ncbi:MAG: sigma-54 dependent transcriptional regulator [Candidatus Krumholzibacteria bacterium]|nr:sigma-54 dependent transcriptional regulator [Candidatus Krumholzibacteria bacterium]
MNKYTGGANSGKPVVLVVDDELSFIQRATRLLGEEYHLEAANSWPKALELLGNRPVSVLLLDYQMRDGKDGIEIIGEIRKTGSQALAIILISKYMDDSLALTGLEAGADHCMAKSTDDDLMRREISGAIRRNYEKRKLLVQGMEEHNLVMPSFRSKNMGILLEQIARFINTNENILITGERGSGKGVLARWIHYKSARSGEILADINIPALNEGTFTGEMFGWEKDAHNHADEMKPGLLELADKGTLILDEIGDLRMDLQAKLLGILEKKPYMRMGGQKSIPFDVRFIAVTNKQCLEEQARQGRFRADLFDRLKTCHIHVPSLRERKEDIPFIAEEMLKKFRQEYNRPELEGLDDSLTERMMEYSWPGNIRDLEIWIKSGVMHAHGDKVTLTDVQKQVRTEEGEPNRFPFEKDWYSLPLAEATDRAQKLLVERALVDSRGKVAEAAKRLGVHRVNLYRVCERLGIDIDQFKISEK